MAVIHVLDKHTAELIAAGEVVERPASVVKELLENSIDAGATQVTVSIESGGVKLIEISDNGTGIDAEYIPTAFIRHATSKIEKPDDLNSIHTLGFRGEALASIAAVAHVTCTTRTKADPSGIKVQNNGGTIESIEEAACPEGTTFVVRDLFFNTPVRLKFLKKPVTEAGYVSDLMMRLILSRPDVSFRYVSQGKTLYHSAGDGKLSSAVFSIYGREMLHSMHEVDGHQAGLILKGFVGVGESGRGSRNHQSFFINGRYMKSSILSAAVEAACRERVLSGKYPTCVLHLTMPYDTVDVNVHPNKLEVRFQNEAAVAEAVEAMFRAESDKAPKREFYPFGYGSAVKQVPERHAIYREIMGYLSIDEVETAREIYLKHESSLLGSVSAGNRDDFRLYMTHMVESYYRAWQDVAGSIRAMSGTIPERSNRSVSEPCSI